MLAEIAAQVIEEIVHEPWRLVIELAQFAVLVLIIKAVAFGFGKRRGMVVNMLAERRHRIEDELLLAEGREAGAAAAPDEAARIAAEAAADAKRLVAEAREQAAAERERILADADAEAVELERQATDALAHEREEVLGGVRDELLDVVTAATRQVLDEGYSPKEQRAMIEDAILESLDDLESVSLT